MLDRNEVICTITWTVQDLLDIFERRGIEPTDENVNAMLSHPLGKHLQDRSIEEGWQILDDLVWLYKTDFLRRPT